MSTLGVWAGLRKLKTDPSVSRTEEEVVLRAGVEVGSGTTPNNDAIWLKGDLGWGILRWCRREPVSKKEYGRDHFF